MPVSKNRTFRDMLDYMTHKDKFKDNFNLFINQDEFQHMHDQDDDDNNYNNSNNGGNWTKFKTGIQDGSDDEENITNLGAEK